MYKQTTSDPISSYLKINTPSNKKKTKAGNSHLICPFCNKATFAITRDDCLGKCFHPDCGKYIVSMPDEQNIPKPHFMVVTPAQSLRDVLEAFAGICHTHLVNQLQKDDILKKYLLEERRLSEDAIVHSEMGLVPDATTLASALKQKSLITDNPTPMNTLEEIYHKIFDPAIKALRKKKKQTAKEQEIEESLTKSFPNAAIQNRIVFPHRDPRTHSIVYISFRKFPAKDFYSWRYPGAPFGLFGLFSISNDTPTFYIVESQYGVMQALSIHPRIPIVASGSASSCDIASLAHLAQELNANPTIIYDNDQAGKAVVDKLREVIDIRVTSVPAPYNDLDDYIRSFNSKKEAIEGLKALASRTKFFTLPIEKVASKIYTIRQRRVKDMRRPFEVQGEAARIIWNDLSKRGKFIKSQESAARPIVYYLFTEQGRVYNLTNAEDLRSLFATYGLNPTELVFKFVIEFVLNNATNTCQTANVSYFSWYDSKKNILYVTDGDNGMYRITKNNIVWMLNGSNNLLLLGNNVAPVKLPIDIDGTVKLKDNTPAFETDIIDSYPFLADEDKCLTIAWIYGFLFRSHFYLSKPILLVEGEKGGGKSTMLKIIGKILIGKSWNVLGDLDQQRFEDKIIYPSFTVLDNLDRSYPWLNNWLAVIATGALVTRRQLYTQINHDYELDTYLAITSRTPRFRREDVAERLLRCQMKKIKSNKRMEGFVDEVSEKRPLYWTSMFKKCQQILRNIEGKKIEEIVPEVLETRLVSFFEIVWTLFPNDIPKLLSYLKTRQAEFVVEESTITYLLEEWVEMEQNSMRWIAAFELFSELLKLAKEKKMRLTFKVPQTLIRYINRNKESLELKLGIENKKMKGKIFWRFTLKEDEASGELEVNAKETEKEVKETKGELDFPPF